MHEVATAYLSEEFSMSRSKAASLVSIACCSIGVICSLSFGPFAGVKLFGMSIFDLFDYVSSNIFLPVGGMFISIFVGWYLDKRLLRDEITNHGTLRIPYLRFVIFVLRYFAPVAIAIILLNQLGLFKML